MASNISSFGVAPLPFVKSSLLGFVIAYFGTFLGELHCPRGDFMPMERKSTLCRLFVLVTLPLIMLKSFKIVHNSACSWPWCRNTASNESWEVNSIRKPTASTPTGSVPPPTWPACPNQLVSMALTSFSISMVWPRENKQKNKPRNAQKKYTYRKTLSGQKKRRAATTITKVKFYKDRDGGAASTLGQPPVPCQPGQAFTPDIVVPTRPGQVQPRKPNNNKPLWPPDFPAALCLMCAQWNLGQGNANRQVAPPPGRQWMHGHRGHMASWTNS